MPSTDDIARHWNEHIRSQPQAPAVDPDVLVFRLARVEPGRVWFVRDPHEELGPVELPVSLTERLRPDWLALLETGRVRGQRRILRVQDLLAPDWDGPAAARPKKARAAAAKTGSWQFTSKLRTRGFGWRSSALAAKRLKESVAEVKLAAKADVQRGADGAVLLISRIEPAFEQVDSSSGALGTAVYNAIEALAPVIAAGSADPAKHRKRLEKLYQADLDAGMGYLDSLGDHWGRMCGTEDIAREWAEFLAPGLESCWRSDAYAYFKGTSACLTSLLACGDYQAVLDLLALQERPQMWSWRRYGVQALERMGRLEEALELARKRALNDSETSLGLACEELLLKLGREDEAYAEYGLHLRRAGTYKASFSALRKRYPKRRPQQVLRDLVAASPEPGAWFTAAVSLGELEVAAEVARDARDPRTLTRAAKAQLAKAPDFAFRVALAALEGIDIGAGYDITSVDVRDAFEVLQKAAEGSGNGAALEAWLSAVAGRSDVSFVRRVLVRR